MANEFIARRGLIALEDSQITGSLNVSQTLSLPGFSDVSASLAAAVAGGDDLGNHTATQDLNMGGNAITSVGNVDGVDVSALNTSVSTNTTNIATLTAATSSYSTATGVENNADVTDTANVTSAGALMDSELSEIATVKALTAAGISGSFNAASASFSTRVTANDAKLTANTSNVQSAGALMDSEVTNLAQVKAFDSSDYATAAQGTKADTAIQPSQTSSFSTATGVEDNADVTDTANVTSAGALMDSELSEIATVKTLTKAGISGSFNTVSSSLAERIFNSTNSEALFIIDSTGGTDNVTDAPTNLTLDSVQFSSSLSTFTISASHAVIVNADMRACISFHVGFDDPTGADRTKGEAFLERSTDNGGTFTEVAGSNAFAYIRNGNNNDTDTATTSNIILSVSSGDRFRVRVRTQASSGLTTSTVANASAFSIFDLLGGAQGPAGPSGSDGSSAIPAGTVSGSSQISHDDTTGFVANEHIDHSTITIGSGKGLSGGGTINTNRSLTLDTGSTHFVDGAAEAVNSASFSTRVTANDAKLTANTSNVTSAGALMDSEVTNLAQVKAFDSSDYATAAQGAKADTAIQPSQTSSFSTATGVEDNADVTDTANVTSAGALMDSELSEIATVKALTAAGISGSFNSVSASLAADIPTNNNQLTNGAGYTTNTGTVDTSGTPADNQVAVFTDSNTIEGSSGFTFNSGTGTLAAQTVLSAGSKLTLNSVDSVVNNSGTLVLGNVSNAVQLRSSGQVAVAGGLDLSSGDLETTGDISGSNGKFTGTLEIQGIANVSASIASAGGGGGGAVSGVANGSNNRVATFSSTDALNGEANMTFDGSTLDVTGDIRATGDVIARYSSDAALKKNIETLEVNSSYLDINGVRFDWDEEKQNRYQGHDIGFIAQEIEQVFPEAVGTRHDGTKAVDYHKLVPPLWEMVKDLHNRLTKLENGRS